MSVTLSPGMTLAATVGMGYLAGRLANSHAHNSVAGGKPAGQAAGRYAMAALVGGIGGMIGLAARNPIATIVGGALMIGGIGGLAGVATAAADAARGEQLSRLGAADTVTP